jgi:hypothetical protein
MSNLACHARDTMKNENDPGPEKLANSLQPKPHTRPACRVQLEPELEAIAAFWSASKRFEMARKFRRWARQLRVSGFILFQDSHPISRPVMRFVALRKAGLN